MPKSASKTINILTGCSHDCRYCYGKKDHWRDLRSTWATPVLRVKAVAKKCKFFGVVMFPSTHDILPEFLGPCVTKIGKLLDAGNQIIIVSKPHLECIERLCSEFQPDNILFRFSIGASTTTF